MGQRSYSRNDARDDTGRELQDLAEAKCEALEFAAKHICDAANAFWDREEWLLSVSDKRGLTSSNCTSLAPNPLPFRSGRPHSAKKRQVRFAFAAASAIESEPASSFPPKSTFRPNV